MNSESQERLKEPKNRWTKQTLNDTMVDLILVLLVILLGVNTFDSVI